MPEPGDVLSYSYLWSHEEAAGRDEGVKDRPVVVVVAILAQEGQIILLVVPITHRPTASGDGVEVPPAVKRHLGLDDERSWIVTTQVNRFIWPGPDVRPTKGQSSPHYGAIPAKLFEQARLQIMAHRSAGNARVIKRTE